MINRLKFLIFDRMTAREYIQYLHLLPHPEGGHYAETYRSGNKFNFPGFEGERVLGTSIYFLLEKGQHSAMHRIKSDELWYYHDGGCLEIIERNPDGSEKVTKLGKRLDLGESLQHVVKAGTWFGARPAPDTAFSLVGCQVSPGFDFRDFELEKTWAFV